MSNNRYQEVIKQMTKKHSRIGMLAFFTLSFTLLASFTVVSNANSATEFHVRDASDLGLDQPTAVVSLVQGENGEASLVFNYESEDWEIAKNPDVFVAGRLVEFNQPDDPRDLFSEVHLTTATGIIEVKFPALSVEIDEPQLVDLTSTDITGPGTAGYRIESILPLSDDRATTVIYVPTTVHAQNIEEVFITDGKRRVGVLASGAVFKADGRLKYGILEFTSEADALFDSPNRQLEILSFRETVSGGVKFAA